MKKINLFLLIFLILISNQFAENLPSESIQQDTEYAIHDKSVNSEKSKFPIYAPTMANHFTAFGEALGSNLILMGINRFIRKAPYAYITQESLKANLTNPWVWDQDDFAINHIGHPYQGSFYYVSGRSNNLPFWESALTTITGSLTWELFAETDTPSYNDLIVTTIGGISIGEMLHRIYFPMSDINKLLGFIISPMTTINNAIWKGKINRPYEDITSISTKLFFGAIMDKTFFKTSLKKKENIVPFFLGGGINIIYGTPYGLKTKTPYSQFDIDVKFSGAKNYYNLSIFSNGMLWSFSPWEQDKLKTTMGVALHYDFLNSIDTNYSQNAIGFTIKQHASLPHNWDIKWDLHLNYIMMSASDFYYLFNKIVDPETDQENRLYDLGFGTGLKTNMMISHPLAGTLTLFYFLDWVDTIESSIPKKGSKGSALIGVGSIAYEHKIYKTLSLGIEYSSYIKSAFYEDIESTFEYNQYLNLYLKNRFK